MFEKPFVTITPDIASSRISSILNLLGIGERNLSKFVDTSVMEAPINYSDIKSRLKKEQIVSMSYLEKATASSTDFTHNK